MNSLFYDPRKNGIKRHIKSFKKYCYKQKKTQNESFTKVLILDYPKNTNPKITDNNTTTKTGANTSKVSSKYTYFFFLSLIL